MARQVIKKVGTAIWGCFIDLKAAYDWINRQRLWEVLKIRLGEQATRIIQVMESRCRQTYAKIDGSKTAIPIEIGLRQGAVESCSLFNYWLDTVLRFALHDIELVLPGAGITRDFSICSENSTREQRMKAAMSGKVVSKIVCFADDIFVTANSENELEVMMNIIAKKFENFDLKDRIKLWTRVRIAESMVRSKLT